MKQIRMIFLLSVTVLVYSSCSTMKNNIHKNNKYTDKVVSSLFQKNGNVFYLSSTSATFSTIWTYNGNRLEVHKLANGKTSFQQEYTTTNINTFKAVPNEELFELDNCMELDGDIFGFKIKRGSEIEKQDLPIDIECFTKLKYKSEFLNKVVEDINTHKLWNVQYE